MMRDYDGLMFIGDPHLEARVPGFRSDDYPQVALKKFAWCLQFARRMNLQPFLLGDLFHLPQDNPNWMVSQIIDVIARHHGKGLPSIYGNHDVRENTRKPNDSISILFSSGDLCLVSAEDPWRGSVAGKRVVVGGTVWGDKIPKSWDDSQQVAADLVAWMTHHDILIPGYEEAGRIRPKELPGIDLIINGHVHRRLDPVSKGHTHWITAGNITRRARSDASKSHIPAVPCLVPTSNPTITADEAIDPFAFESCRGDGWDLRWVRVPHQSFEEVFHGDVIDEEAESEDQASSGFVADLRELTMRKTDTGAGLMQYLEQNLDHFDDAVGEEIMRLASEVTDST